MKRITYPTRGRNRDGLHIEAPGCIVSIRGDLHNAAGQSVTSVEVVCDDYAGEPARYIADDDPTRRWDDLASTIHANVRSFEAMTPREIIDFLRQRLDVPARPRYANVRVIREQEQEETSGGREHCDKCCAELEESQIGLCDDCQKGSSQ